MCKILKKFNVEECNVASTPVVAGLKLKEEKEAQLIDAILIYSSRPYIKFGVGLLSKFMHDPRVPHVCCEAYFVELENNRLWNSIS